MNLKKYSCTIMVLLHQNRRVEEAKSPNVIALVGYYQNVSVYAATEAEAVAVLRASVPDGRIDWSESTLHETRKGFVDWIRMLTSRKVVAEGGKAFFPKDEGRDSAANGEPIGWRL